MQKNWCCSKCNTSNCSMCREESHPGETCEQSRLLKPHRIDNEKAIRKISKRCPGKDCGRFIHKPSGCSHMYCLEANGRLISFSVSCCWLMCQVDAEWNFVGNAKLSFCGMMTWATIILGFTNISRAALWLEDSMKLMNLQWDLRGLMNNIGMTMMLILDMRVGLLIPRSGCDSIWATPRRLLSPTITMFQNNNWLI